MMGWALEGEIEVHKAFTHMRFVMEEVRKGPPAVSGRDSECEV
jgi:hypothetical protein